MASFHSKHRALALVTAAALALPVSSLASDEPVFSLTFENGVITPQTLEIPAGKTVILHVENKGTSAAEFESKQLHIEKAIAPGAILEVTLRGVVAGNYKFVDEFTENLDTANGIIVAK